MSWSLPCHKCGAQPGQPCTNLRTGQPTKYEHAGQRYMEFNVLTAADLGSKAGRPMSDDDDDDTSGHDMDAPIVITYDDGTTVTMPSLNEMIAEQDAAWQQAKAMGLLDWLDQP